MGVVGGVVDAKEVQRAEQHLQAVELLGGIGRTGGDVHMRVIAHLGLALRQRPAQHKVGHDGGFVPDPKHGRAHHGKQIGRQAFKLVQHGAQQGPWRVGKGAVSVRVGAVCRGLTQPLARQAAGVFQRGGIGAHGLLADRRFVGPTHVQAAVPEPVGQVNRGAKKHIVVEVKKPLRQAFNMVDIGLDMARVKRGPCGLGNQGTVVY